MKRWVDSEELGPAESEARALLLAVEVPPPNPQARARGWARLQAKRRAPTPFFRIGMVGAALGALLVWVAPWSADPELVVVAADADQSLVGLPLAPARPWSVGEGERVQLVGGWAGRLVVSAGSELELLGAAHDHLRLGRGRLERQGGALDWTLESPPYQLIARGDFWVARMGEAITVEVQSGEVELRGPGLERVLHAGQRYQSSDPTLGAPSGRQPAGAPATESASQLAGAAAADVASQLAGAPAVDAASQLAGAPAVDVASQLAGGTPAEVGGRAAAAPVAEGRRPGANVAPPPGRRQGPRAAARALGSEDRAEVSKTMAEPSGRARTDDDPGREPGAPRTPDDATLETPAIPRSASAPQAPAADSWATLYRRAQETRSPARAIPLFDQVAASDSPYAEVAGHQAARLVMRQDAGLAIPRYQRLLARFPSGAYAPEGRLNLIECRLITQDLDGASRELEAFLARYPSSERTAELLRMKDNLARRKKP